MDNQLDNSVSSPIAPPEAPVQRNAPLPLDSLLPILRDLPRSPPRRAALPGLTLRSSPLRMLGTILPFALGIPLLLLAVIFATTTQSRRAAASRGQVTGTLVSREKIGAGLTSGSAVPSYFLKYRFTVQGRIYQGNCLDPSESALSALAPGSPLVVSYQRQNPAQNQPLSQIRQMQGDSDLGSIWPIFLVLPPLILLFVAGPVLGAPLRAWWRIYRLYPRAMLCNGTIEWVKPRSVISSQGHASGGSQVLYRFRDNAGVEHVGKMPCDNPWLLNQFRVGSPVVVAYDPQKPERSFFLEPFAA